MTFEEIEKHINEFKKNNADKLEQMREKLAKLREEVAEDERKCDAAIEADDLNAYQKASDNRQKHITTIEYYERQIANIKNNAEYQTDLKTTQRGLFAELLRLREDMAERLEAVAGGILEEYKAAEKDYRRLASDLERIGKPFGLRPDDSILYAYSRINPIVTPLEKMIENKGRDRVACVQDENNDDCEGLEVVEAEMY